MSDTDTRLGKILDDAFEMGRGLHPEDYTNLRSGMLKKAEALINEAVRAARIDEWKRMEREYPTAPYIPDFIWKERLAALSKDKEETGEN